MNYCEYVWQAKKRCSPTKDCKASHGMIPVWRPMSVLNSTYLSEALLAGLGRGGSWGSIASMLVETMRRGALQNDGLWYDQMAKHSTFHSDGASL